MPAPRNLIPAIFVVCLALGCRGGKGVKGTSAPTGPATSQGTRAVATIHAMDQAFDANDVKAYGALFTDDVALNVSGRADVRG